MAATLTSDALDQFAYGGMAILTLGDGASIPGYIVQSALSVTAETINFMATHGRGLVAIAMAPDIFDQLGIAMHPARGDGRENQSGVSIEARDGVGTGISASDRARTIQVAADPNSSRADIVTPGHIFPMRARDGGTLVKPGAIEAAVDLSLLSGQRAASAICAILDAEGHAADMATLRVLAAEHSLPMIAIDDVIAQRRLCEAIIERVAERNIVSDIGGDFRAIVYRNRLDGREIVALVKGEVGGDEPTLVRVHESLPFYDLIAMSGPRSRLLHRCMRMIAERGRGVIVMLDNAQPNLMARTLMAGDHAPALQFGDFGLGAQVLADLGIEKVELLTTLQRHWVGMAGFGLSVTGITPLLDDITQDAQ